MNVETAVGERYSAASNTREEALCCPVDYDPKFLAIIPQRVIDRDYGCGDPSKYVAHGETVLDLGSGGGKICFIASQVVGATGKVIGVDMNDDMLELANGAKGEIAATLGYDNVEFLKGEIQALQGLVDDNSIDVVVSNCVLNLVSEVDKPQLFAELHRVLKRGGRAVISDIVSDEFSTDDMKNDADLWSGCISGALQESEFLKAFEDAGFYGVEILKRDTDPWQTVQGIEFRSVTIAAYKGKEGVCMEHKDAVIYKGPFKSVLDDDGHTYPRGERIAVCRKTYEILTRAPYNTQFEGIPARIQIAAEDATEFPCNAGVLLRTPEATKGEGYNLTTEATNAAGPEGCC